MPTGRNNKLTGQVGEFLVCAELGRRGLIATPFAGNVPAFDILAADELCRTVPIQVKASNGASWRFDARDWMDIELDENGRQNYNGPKEIVNPELIYVFVAIASKDSLERDRFFVLTKSELQDATIKDYSTWMDERNWTRPKNPASYAVHYWIEAIAEYENRWELIERRLESAQSSSVLETDSE